MITSIKWINNSIIKIIDDTGNVKYASWPNVTYIRDLIQEALDSGIIIEQKDPPIPDLDLSNIDNLDKVLKAIGLTIAQITSTPNSQVKQIFKQKYESL